MATINKIPKCPPLRFPDFNDDWKETSLGEIASFFSGGTPSTTQKEFYEGDIPFIRSGEIHSKNTEIKISKSALYNSSAKLVEVEDILLALYGATSGDIAISQIRGAINQAILCIRPYCDFNKHYVFYYWQRNYSRVVKKYLQGGQGNLSAEVVKSVLFRYPSLTEQKKIADFLSLIDERIHSLSETIRELKNQKAALLNQLFSQKLRFPDFNDEWTQTTLGEVLIKPQQKAVEDPTNTELITVKLHCKGIVNTGKYPNKTEKGRAYYIRYTGELLIGKQNFHNGGIGIVPHVCSGKICSNAIASYISKDQYIEYIYYYISRETYYSLFEKYLGGTGQKEISASEFNNLPISLPSLEEQKKIADFLSLIDERIEVEEQLLQQYEKQKRYLLKQMFV